MQKKIFHKRHLPVVSTQAKVFIRRVYLSIAHGVWLLLLNYLWLNTGYLLTIEEHLFRFNAKIKDLFIGSDVQDEIDKTFCFIDVSGNRKMVPLENGNGVESIVDRSALASFFDVLNNHYGEYTYVFCDVLFDRLTEDDAALIDALDGSGTYLLPYGFEDGELVAPLFGAGHLAYAGVGVSQGIGASEKAAKFELFAFNNIKTVPLVLYERINDKHAERKMGLVWIGDNAVLNTVILNLSVNMGGTPSGSYTSAIPLTQLLNLLNADEDKFFNEFLKNRVIILGDFKNDLHETAYGQIPGPLIISNLFALLQSGKLFISWKWLAFLLVSFSFVSYFVLFPATNVKLRSWIAAKGIRWAVNISLYMWLISIVSYLIFDFHFNFIVLIFYLNGIYWLIMVWVKYKRSILRKFVVNRLKREKLRVY